MRLVFAIAKADPMAPLPERTSSTKIEAHYSFAMSPQGSWPIYKTAEGIAIGDYPGGTYVLFTGQEWADVCLQLALRAGLQ